MKPRYRIFFPEKVHPDMQYVVFKPLHSRQDFYYVLSPYSGCHQHGSPVIFDIDYKYYPEEKHPPIEDILDL